MIMTFFDHKELDWINPEKFKDKIKLKTPLDITLQRREFEDPRLSYCVLAWYERYERFKEVVRPLPPGIMYILIAGGPNPHAKREPNYDIFPPRIVFHKNNMKAVYDSIPPEIRGDANYHQIPLIPNAGLWAIMTNCIFYHELGHHLVQLFTERPDNKGVKRTDMYDEQKLCEYIAFKKMHEKLTTENSLLLPSKYTNSIENDGIIWTDIGVSEIYRSRMSKNNVMKGINSVNNTNFTNTQASEILNWIFAAFGGRGKGERYYPEITSDTQAMIDTDPAVWEQLYDLIYNDDSTTVNPYGLTPIAKEYSTTLMGENIYNEQYTYIKGDPWASRIINWETIMSYKSKDYFPQPRRRSWEYFEWQRKDSF